ncbi:MAG TPA: calcium-translocating P-type ATPase, PMCA-type [Bacilli bacterium]|nr:calcium-translocating P-type ATPase, PMCA-type [Bacilli bacterium]
MNNKYSTGLNNEEVLKSRKEYGSNKITDKKQDGFIKLLIESLGDPIIKILLIALAIKVVFLFQDFDWFETLGIVIAIFLASFISSISEYGSEQAFKRLEQEAKKSLVRVIRNNNIEEIPIDDVVKNDIVLLSSGDKVPADGILIEGEIDVDESVLNGETKENEKNTINNRNLLRGSIVVNKEGKMLVTQVGDKTVYGSLALEIQEKQPESPLKIRLRGLAKVISRIGYIGAVLVSFSYLFSVIVINNNFDLNKIINTVTNFKIMFEYIIYALTLSVTIIVVAVPEGLPMMITLVLSSNMKRMLKNNVLVRKLVGIETAGSINLLLTDKTGTITKGKLEVTSIITGDLKKYSNHLEIEPYKKLANYLDMSMVINNASKLDNNNNVIGGNITDRALLKFCNKKYTNINIVNSIPFNSTNKYAITIIKHDQKNIALIKGAQEKILPYCKYYIDQNGSKKPLLNQNKIKTVIKEETLKGSRVLLLAINDNINSLNYISNLALVGIVLIKDEIRKEAIEGLNLVKNAHIETIMITGDSKETAIAIGKEINLIQNKNDLVLTSHDLNKLSDEEVSKILPNIKVIARALPSDKSRLVKIAQSNNLVVGMTGDGVNDAPALKKCDVGFAMGSGTEVAKSAADIVIMDDNILSISKAILFGRTIFKSIRKFIIFQLTVNICALTISIIGPFIGINTPITIIQMLWINMIMDTLAGLAFSFEPPLNEYMNEYPKQKDEAIINKYMYTEILITGFYSALICILFLKLPIVRTIIRVEDNYKYLMTAYFALFIFISIFNAFNARTKRINLLSNLTKNIVFLITFILIIIIQIYLIYFGGDLFRTYGLTSLEFIFVIILAFSVIPFDMIRKIIIKKKKLHNHV